ncbi:MAG: TRAP transporter large permease [Burkholderiaceae bacterium]
MTLSLFAFIALLGLTFVGIPIAWAMIGIGFGGVALLRGVDPALAMAGQVAFETAMSYDLSVVPMFVLMGNLVNHARMSHQLYEAAHSFVGHRRGGLALATILSCGGFSAISGSSVATAATMAKVAIPSMRRFGYSSDFAAATVAAGGTLGILIPPSVVMVVYGILSRTDIGELFVAGILPGALAIVLYLVAIEWTVRRNPAVGPAGPRSTAAQRLALLRPVWPVALLFIALIGGLYAKVFTPTEGAGIGAFGALLLALGKRTLTLSSLLRVFAETVRTSAVMFAILIGGLMFANFVNLAGLTTTLQAWISSAEVAPLAVVFMIICIYLVLGCVLDSMAMIILTIPVFFPVVMQLGYDPVWFGVLVVMVVELALITPPVGMNVFVISGVFRDIGTGRIFRAVVPFIAVDLIRVSLLVLFPALALALPSLMR